MSSRKVLMSKWKEGHRRSPRISALDACKAQQSRRVPPTPLALDELQVPRPQPQGPASRTRARKKRKLRPLEDVAGTPFSPIARQYPMPNVLHGSDQQRPESHPTSTDQPTVHDRNSPKPEDQANSPNKLSSVPYSQWMPEKRILELILDILQRRDTYEIFAEPVNPEEVEDYYEIIKEPMDFGTMRAKLHEGMYRSIEQFEHDAFLISENAMHFNSTTTIYFRQARAIHELAKKVFHALKTDPENFESEFSDTRRRTGRRPINEVRGPLYTSHSAVQKKYTSNSKLVTNLRSSSIPDVSSKTMPSLLCNSSYHMRNARGTPGCPGNAAQFNARDQEVLSGAKGGRRNNFSEADRRGTYRPWMSVVSTNDIIDSMVSNSSKPLIQVPLQDISYKDSLMLFAKDLGPTAQMVAKRKLIGCSVNASNCLTSGSNCAQEPNFHDPSASIYTQSAVTMTMPKIVNLHGCPILYENSIYKMESSYSGEREKSYSALTEAASSSDEKKIPGAVRGSAQSTGAMNVFGPFGNEQLCQDQHTGVQLGSYTNRGAARELNFSGNELPISGTSSTLRDKSRSDNQAQQVKSTLEQSQADTWNYRSQKDGKSLPSWPQQTMGMSDYGQTIVSSHNQSSLDLGSNDQDTNAQYESHEISCLSQLGQVLKASQSMQTGSQFIFDLPFLKTRLDQIKSSGKDKLSQEGIGAEDPFLDKIGNERSLAPTHQKELSSKTCNDGYQHFSLDAQHRDLALQL